MQSRQSLVENLTSVRGIRCWGAYTGVKSMRRDLAIILSEVVANASAVFTQNEVVAEPVKISREHIKNGKARLLVVNAGNANACTGRQGAEGARAMVEAAAEAYGLPKEEVLIASTGIIGREFPTEQVVQGIRENANKLSNDSRAGTFVANAIMTTDTFAKEGFLRFTLDGKTVNMAGVAKGSGMVHPNMATMLAFIVTDAAIAQPLLDKAFREAVKRSFNMITVDGDTSTNDMASIMANGMADNPEITAEDNASYRLFCEKLEELCRHLAKLIVSDGEGASKFIEYRVVNASDEDTARRIIRTVSNSSLVKAAMFGRDPNWGRIVAAAGRAGVPFDYTAVDLYIGTRDGLVPMLLQGEPQELDQVRMKRILREPEIHIEMDMHQGDASATGWGADLTTDYVLFNSTYTT